MMQDLKVGTYRREREKYFITVNKIKSPSWKKPLNNLITLVNQHKNSAQQWKPMIEIPKNKKQTTLFARQLKN